MRKAMLLVLLLLLIMILLIIPGARSARKQVTLTPALSLRRGSKTASRRESGLHTTTSSFSLSEKVRMRVREDKQRFLSSS